jgi:hypothetical protein
MRILFVLGAAAFCAGAATAAPAPETSWGKAGVTLRDYREDATRCLSLVEHLDLTGTRPADALIQGTRRIESIYAQEGGEQMSDTPVQPGSRIMNVVEFTRPQHQINEIRDLMRVAMDACLTELGYSRFRLTETQREALRRLRYGRAERHAYLHRLASDPAVLAAQAVSTGGE